MHSDVEHNTKIGFSQCLLTVRVNHTNRGVDWEQRGTTRTTNLPNNLYSYRIVSKREGVESRCTRYSTPSLRALVLCYHVTQDIPWGVYGSGEIPSMEMQRRGTFSDPQGFPGHVRRRMGGGVEWSDGG